MAINKLVLFDVDETLIKGSRGLKGHGAHFSEAFRRVYGIETSIDIINYHGMTDQQIAVEVLKKCGLKERTIKLKLKECIGAMVNSFNKAIDTYEVVVLGGVRELLKKLDESDVLMGLVTGNLEPIAMVKLKKAGLSHYFVVGGFGSDDICRTKLVRLAMERARGNFCFDRGNVFLFGDAPQDMKAGKEAGVKTVGVTTGIYSKKQLEGAGADVVLKNLENTVNVLRAIEK